MPKQSRLRSNDRSPRRPGAWWIAAGPAGRLVGAAAIGLAVLAGLAGVTAGEGNGLAADLMRLCGVEAHVRALGDSMHAAADRRAEDLSPDPARRLRDAAAAIDAAEPGALLTVAREQFVSSDDTARAQEAIAFLRSPVGSRMRALEAEAEAGIDEAELTRFVEESFSRPVPLERIRVLVRLAEATRAAELSARTEAIAERAVARAAHALRSRDARFDEPATRGAKSASLAAELGRIDSRRDAMAATWRAQSSIFMQFVYREASDDELDRYAAFAESPTGQWLVDATARTLTDLEPWLDGELANALDRSATELPAARDSHR